MSEAEWVGTWDVTIHPGPGVEALRLEASLELSADGGSWKVYSPQLVEKFAFCLTRRSPVSRVQASEFGITLSVKSSEVIATCSDELFTLVKVGNEIQGMSTGGFGYAIRMRKR
jgi:hypothetical protein